MGLYKCKICGKEFERVGNGVYCPGPHYRPCPVCGKPVEFQRPSEPIKCCSSECTATMTRNTRKHKPKKRCAECGTEFQPVNGTQLYCPGPHTSVCEICGSTFSYTCSPRFKPHTCSRKCQETLRSKTALSRYGVENVSQLDSVKAKISKVKSSEEAKARVVATVQKRYGVDNVSQAPQVRAKLSEVMKTERYLKDREQTCLERYGFTSPSMAESVKKKREETNYQRYGAAHPPHTKGFFQKRMLDGSKAEDFMNFREDPASYIQSNFDHAPTISEMCAALGCTDTPIYNVLLKFGCSDMLSSSTSSMEQEVSNFIESLIPNIKIRHNDRSVIAPRELDLYLPDYQLGIECNPTATHNSSSEDPWGGPPKPAIYHQEKSIQALKQGVLVFHIFGYEWSNKKEIIQSMLTNLLKANTETIGARDTYVCDVPYLECKRFLDANHLQGDTNSSIRLGLRHKRTDELLSVMTFGRIRPSMGTSTLTNDRPWELSRFCNQKFTSVSGSASKLFQHFLNRIHPEVVVSFSDVAHTRGSLYQTLGFKSSEPSYPNYVWATLNDAIYFNRVNCQKRNLPKLLHDDSIDIVNNTERQIMESHGFLQVFNSGTIRWVWSIRHETSLRNEL